MLLLPWNVIPTASAAQLLLSASLSDTQQSKVLQQVDQSRTAQRTLEQHPCASTKGSGNVLADGGKYTHIMAIPFS